MTPTALIRLSFTLSTAYAILSLILYVLKRDVTIPLTYRTTLYDWGALKTLFEGKPLNLTQSEYNAALWCIGPDTSPQCSCLYKAYTSTYTRNALAYPAAGQSLKDLAKLQYTDLINACLGSRTSWRKDTCDYWCRVHLTTPVTLASLFMSLFLSRAVRFESRLLQMTARLLPIALCLLTIAAHIGIDLQGGIIASLSVLVALYEISFSACDCEDGAQVYWNLQRYIASPIAAWAAATQQARDVYLVSSYAILGYTLGTLANAQYLLRYRQGCNPRIRVVALYLWVGMCVIAACFLLLVQQHAYPASPAWSSLASVLALFVICAQCVSNAPGAHVDDTVQVGVSLATLSVCVVAVAWDALAR